MARPNCYQCENRRSLPGDAHSACASRVAQVVGNQHGINNGWFYWPFNFDPVWLEACTDFTPIGQVKKSPETNQG